MASAISSFSPPPLQAQLQVSGDASLEGRFFVEEPRQESQLDGSQISLALEPEFFFETKGGGHQYSLVPFARIDSEDDERTHFDLREAYWRALGKRWDLTVGVNTVFWGVTESRHLINIVNQIDAVEDVDQEDFLGQPMVALGLRFPWGRLELFILPGFRERTFPGEKGRLRGDLVVKSDEALFESSRGDDATDLALRYSHFFGDWDVGVNYFHGTSREPRLVPDPGGAAGEVIPVYDRIQQLGIDVQLTRGAWLYKLEAIRRFSELDDFGAWVAGFEYTFFQAWRDADLGLLIEGLYDGRDPLLAPATVSDSDIFLGARLSLNDLAETSVLAGSVVDLNHGSRSLRVEAERRLVRAWTLELSGQFLFGTDDEDPLAAFEEDDFVQLRLNWSF